MADAVSTTAVTEISETQKEVVEGLVKGCCTTPNNNENETPVALSETEVPVTKLEGELKEVRKLPCENHKFSSKVLLVKFMCCF